ncbi:hypothetical protein ISU10_15195 [Nocardioides agariphilus]|jgi:hypothetical protein|uniref:DUF4386 family protein n=1 Tax=Nocardioides agariphilus TaxID=433664 RepID=A0A930VLZ5_9ACTN|nr:hypothetical protein [Nocardioides agariphilus]MBF4769112.1 hypothetical protein [Nocardioides agariphilus]
MTSTSSTATSTASTDGVTTSRIRVVAGALAASALTSALLLISTPWGDRYNSSADEVLDYERLAPVRDGAWGGMLADGIAFAVLGVTLSLVVCHLVRGRGRVSALVGSAITTVGGICFAMGGFAFASITWFASGISEGAGRELVDYANDNVPHLLGATMAGFASFTLGSLVVVAALFRARAVPSTALAAYVVLVLAQFAPLPGRAIDFVQIAMMVLVLALGVSVLRRPV